MLVRNARHSVELLVPLRVRKTQPSGSRTAGWPRPCPTTDSYATWPACAISCDDRLSCGRARHQRDGRDDGGPDQVKPTFRSKCPSLRLSTPPPAQCTMNASRMMARITTTTQKKNTMMPGMAYPATVLALATAASYPPPPGLFSLFGGFCRARKRGRPATGGTAASSRTRHRASLFCWAWS